MKPHISQERNPFADSASLLLRVALTNPTKAWGVRELSRMAGTSPTLTVLTLRRLERVGHVSRESSGEARILDPVRLMRDWAAWYSIKPIKSYRFDIPGMASTQRILNLLSRTHSNLPGKWALTSMAGASLVAPYAPASEIHIHLPNADVMRHSWQKILKLVPNKLGNFHLIEPYYTDSGTYGMQTIDKLPVVSDIQLYLDCSRYPVRGSEQAEHLLSQVLIPRWKNDRQAIG